MMMCEGNVFRNVKTVGIVGILHTHTHTHINTAEKIFKSWYKEAMNRSSWSNFLCGERLWIATGLTTLAMTDGKCAKRLNKYGAIMKGGEDD